MIPSGGGRSKAIENPALIPVANEAYGPTPEEVVWAKKVIIARRGAPANGEYYVDGAQIDSQYEALTERIFSFGMAIDQTEHDRPKAGPR